jgi:hypothetical protein
MGRRWLVLLTLMVLVGGVSCTRASRDRELNANIDLIGPLFPPPVGLGQVVIRVSDLNGNPVEDAQVTVRGDMAHAGMVPIMASAERVGDGQYRAGMDWTMAGDWVITVEATLADGRIASRTFDMAVTSEEPECNDTE